MLLVVIILLLMAGLHAQAESNSQSHSHHSHSHSHHSQSHSHHSRSHSNSQSQSNTQSQSESLSGSPVFKSTGAIPYQGGESCAMDDTCCTEFAKIGFTFKYYCTAYTSFTADTRGSFFFHADGGYACNGPDYIQLLSDIVDGLAASSYIGKHSVHFRGQAATVIEWSGAFDTDYDNEMSIGTYQLWLFPDGVIGMVYHMPENFITSTYGDGDETPRVNIQTLRLNAYGHHPFYPGYILRGFLLDSPAFILTPSPTDCSLPYTVGNWHNPPDVCLNGNSTMQSGSQSQSAKQSPTATDTGNQANFGSLHYKPLRTCGVRPSALVVAPNVDKQEASAIMGTILTFAVVGIIAMVIFAVLF